MISVSDNSNKEIKMGLNDTASADRVHIGFFGMRNAGKSSLVNAVTGQDMSVVSDVLGTTTDPVKKAMEILPLGPCVVIDTPGIDDEGELGSMRVAKAKRVLAAADIAVLVVDASKGLRAPDNELIDAINKRNLPYVIAYNKSDILDTIPTSDPNAIFVSAKNNTGVNELREKIAALAKKEENEKKICADLLSPGDHVVLVTPIDESAPKGRLILPQQQTIRDILDAGCTVTIARDTELGEALAALKNPPKLVITDSQAFGKVSKIVPENILLTSFSILFARYKGTLERAVRGAAQLSKLKDGDKILMAEGCTHHRQCGDIGAVKIPAWIRKYSECEPIFEFSSGNSFPENLEKYKLIIHCGGCMLTEREMAFRGRLSDDAEIPMTNYGIAIAQLHGILKRSLSPFPEILKELD